MKPFVHHDMDNIIDYLILRPENDKEKHQLARISKAVSTNVHITDTSFPDLAAEVIIQIIIKPSVNNM